MKELLAIQSELKCEKSQYNSFGKYSYRSVEDILEAVKPLLNKHDCVLTISDEIRSAGDYVYVHASVILQKSDLSAESRVICQAQAGIEKAGGMALPQAFGSASSYARKYALNGLFLIDDTADADRTNTHGKEKPAKKAVAKKAVFKKKETDNSIPF